MDESDPGGIVERLCGRVTGPLRPFTAGLCQEMSRQCYAPSSVVTVLRLMVRLSGWLEEEGLPAAGLTPQVIEEYRRRRRDLTAAQAPGRLSLRPLLWYLRGLGVVPDPAVEPVGTPMEALLESYRGYLAGERGLAAKTTRCYLRYARVFLADVPDPLGAGLRNLRAEQVTTFVLRACRGRNTGSAKAMVGALRSLLRFLHVAGHVPVALAAAAPTVAGWRLTWLPRGLTAAEVTSLLDSCDLGTVAGRRDYAILVLLARLGLRTVEVAALELDDIDWRSGELVIRGKGNRIEALPLPVAVGQALAGYLTGGRPAAAGRRLFLTVCAPQAGLSAGGVQARVGRACARAGLPSLGAHRLRHWLATDMLRAGTPLAEVGQVLRHRSLVSTAIYAKADWEALRTLAQRWPAGGV